MSGASEAWGPWRSGSVKANLGGCPSVVWELYTNDLFIVTAVPFTCDLGRCVHLVMRLKPVAVLVSNDGGMPIPLPPAAGLTWAVKQRIKSELVGDGRVAVEVFPPASELVDQAEAYHLWVLPEGFRLPFGVEEGGDA